MSNYHFKSKIITGSLVNLAIEIDTQKSKHILLLSSPSVIKNGIIKNFINQVESSGIKLSVFSKIRPDAPIDTLDDLIEQISKPDLVIGIGGGSVMDSSKAISLGWQDATIYELFYKQKSLPTIKVPVYAVPTTAGTGAELSYGAILYDTKNKIKGGIRGTLLQPDKVFIDIELYKTAPSKLIAEVGFDCLTHAIETYISNASNPLVQFQSVAAINTIFSYLPDAVLKNESALQKVAIAASMMGINLALSSTCLPHRIQYVIGPLTQTSHAFGLIMLYNGWLIEVKNTQGYKMLATDLSMEEDEFSGRIKQLKRDLNIDYKLGDYGLAEIDIRNIADKVKGNLTNDPCYKSTQTIINILKNSL